MSADLRLELLTAMIRESLLNPTRVRRLLGSVHLHSLQMEAMRAYADDTARNLAGTILMLILENSPDGEIRGLQLPHEVK